MKLKKFCHKSLFVHHLKSEKAKGGCFSMNENSFLKVELIQTFDLINQKHVEEMNVKVGIKAIQQGLIKELGTNEFAVLVAIASFCDVDGEAFPSQRTLSEVTGLSLPTVNRVINKLLDTKINGVSILQRQFEKSSTKKKFSVYTLNVNKDESDSPVEVNVEQTEQKATKRTARDFAFEFKKRYEKQYGIPYVINYAKDTSLIKKKLIGQFTEEQILQMFDFVMENYRSKWAKANYPYPTISMICSWLGNVAIQQIEEQKKADQEQKEIQAITDQYADDDYSSFDML